MDRSAIAGEFYIEDHAVLFALIAREAVTRFGGDGVSAVERAVASYCMERGARAAQRCLADGVELSMENYILYGEWDDPKGESSSGAIAFEPYYRTNVTVCGWCEAWKRHGLMEWGRIYCDHADHYLVRGFNPELTLEMGHILSHGGESCEFHWKGCHFSGPSDVSSRRRVKIPRVTKDFLYHCGHLLATSRRELVFGLGLIKGDEAVSSALAGYEHIFGAPKRGALVAETEQNFLPL